jgi:hypothetical protein
VFVVTESIRPEQDKVGAEGSEFVLGRVRIWGVEREGVEAVKALNLSWEIWILGDGEDQRRMGG